MNNLISKLRQLESKIDSELADYQRHEDWIEYSEPFRESFQERLMILSKEPNLLQEFEGLMK
jgi:hypothetical protein